MFFSKPKIYKGEGEAAALILVDKIKSEGIQNFLGNAEHYVEDALQRHGIFKSSTNQRKQICQLAIKFNEYQITRSENTEKIPSLREQILIDLL
tara:strand:- start:528 stop:809 length:282 start_codon:yes stop_codon:yes gene_type:complete